MKIFLPGKYRDYLCASGLSLVLLAGITGIVGCGPKADATTSATVAGASAPGGTSQPGSASDAEMRKSFQQKTFDINSVPASQRDRVQAIMDAQKNRTK